jgi:hypothetical protein
MSKKWNMMSDEAAMKQNPHFVRETALNNIASVGVIDLGLDQSLHLDQRIQPWPVETAGFGHNALIVGRDDEGLCERLNLFDD